MTKTVNGDLRIFSGNANPALAQKIAAHLGMDLGNMRVERFADGEIDVQILESVRAHDCYIIQPTCPPVNENLMELLIMIDAFKRASAGKITAVNLPQHTSILKSIILPRIRPSQRFITSLSIITVKLSSI